MVAKALILLSIFAQVKTVELNSNSLPAVGVQLSWPAVAGATYDVYSYPAYGGYNNCTTGPWKEIATVTVPGYTFYPAPDANGYGGTFCFGVATNGGAIVSATKPVTFGAKWYFIWEYWSADCLTPLGNPTGNGSFVLTRSRAGVSTVMPGVMATNLTRWAGFFRMLSSDTYTGTFTLPDGKVLTFPHIFMDHTDNVTVADYAPYLTIGLNISDDSFCRQDHYGYYQRASDNP